MRGFRRATKRTGDDDPAIARAIRLRDAGDFRAAGDAFKAAAADSHPLVRSTARLMLGRMLLDNLGDARAAVPLLEAAWELGHPKVAPLAALELAHACEALGEEDRRQELLRWVWQQDVDRFSAIAAGELTQALVDAGDWDEVRRAISYVCDHGAAAMAASSYRNLGDLEQRDGNVDAARRAYETAIARGVQDPAAVRLKLAVIQAEQHEFAAARQSCELALREGVDHAATVRFALAKLQHRLGDDVAARESYAAVVNAGAEDFDPQHEDPRPDAAFILAELDRRAGRLDEARATLTSLSTADDALVSSRAIAKLATMDDHAGNKAAARAGYERALARAGSSALVPSARLGLARFQEREGSLGAALAGYTEVAATGTELLQASALYGQGRVLARQGDLAAARKALTESLERPVPSEYRSAVEQRLRELDASQPDRAPLDENLETDGDAPRIDLSDG